MGEQCLPPQTPRLKLGLVLMNDGEARGEWHIPPGPKEFSNLAALRKWKTKKPLRPEKKNPAAAWKMRRDGGRAHVQAARISPERRQHDLARIGHKARPHDLARARRHPRLWMEMARNFTAAASGGLVAEGNAAQAEIAGLAAADTLRRFGIMIALHPEEIAGGRDLAQARGILAGPGAPGPWLS